MQKVYCAYSASLQLCKKKLHKYYLDFTENVTEEEGLTTNTEYLLSPLFSFDRIIFASEFYLWS